MPQPSPLLIIERDASGPPPGQLPGGRRRDGLLGSVGGAGQLGWRSAIHRSACVVAFRFSALVLELVVVKLLLVVEQRQLTGEFDSKHVALVGVGAIERLVFEHFDDRFLNDEVPEVGAPVYRL